MGQEMPDRNRPFGWAQTRLAIRVRAFETYRRRQLRQDIAGFLIKMQSALFNQLHPHWGGKSLGHRPYPEQRIRRYGRICMDFGFAEHSLIHRALPRELRGRSVP
jgi:hypothetical protein